jgi:hypothetical protein
MTAGILLAVALFSQGPRTSFISAEDVNGASGASDYDVPLVQAQPRAPVIPPPPPPPPPPSAPPASLDFDLLGDEGKVAVDPDAEKIQAAMNRRRTLLTAHQITGFALSGLMLGSIISGQLNYSDKFGGPNTGRFKLTHTVFTVSTEVVFAVAGGLALFAPTPIKQPKDSSWSRADWHRYGMLGATGGMVAEAVLGFYTASREGYVNQSSVATAHLAIGYTTLSFMLVAVGALVL